MIHLLGQERGSYVSQATEQVDLLPTILDLVGAPKPSWTDGASLKPELEGKVLPDRFIFSRNLEPDRIFGSVSKGTLAVIDDEFRYVIRLDSHQESLYRYRTDSPRGLTTLSPLNLTLPNVCAMCCNPSWTKLMSDTLADRARAGGDLWRERRSLRISLGAWRRLARQIDTGNSRLNWQTKLAYWFSGIGSSLLTRIQHASHADRIGAALPAPPLFVLGFWRSGTTFLHELFSCDPRFGFASTYACLNPSHFLLTEKWMRSAKPSWTIRPMDKMLYSWTSPQEDEFALFALGAPSAYEAVIVPSLMRRPRSLLDVRQRSPEELNRWTETLQYFIQLLTAQQGKPLVLKSPPHGFRLPLLSSLFPRARYVVLERNPYEVFASNLKLWRTLLDLYSVEVISSDELEEFVLAAYVMHEEAITEGSRLIDPQLIARVRYEELVRDPVWRMARLYEELQLEDFAAVRPQLERYVASVADHERNRFRLSPAQLERVNSAWGKLIEEKGYGWPGGHVTVA